MNHPKPLTGTELIDCAKANAKQGLEQAAYYCGYGHDIEAFQTQLEQACQDIGVEYNQLGDLVTHQQVVLHQA